MIPLSILIYDPSGESCRFDSIWIFVRAHLNNYSNYGMVTVEHWSMEMLAVECARVMISSSYYIQSLTITVSAATLVQLQRKNK